jgi:hypothetical protein
MTERAAACDLTQKAVVQHASRHRSTRPLDFVLDGSLRRGSREIVRYVPNSIQGRLGSRWRLPLTILTGTISIILLVGASSVSFSQQSPQLSE